MADAGTWDEAKLMGIGDDSKGADKIKDDPMLWGVPGSFNQGGSRDLRELLQNC